MNSKVNSLEEKVKLPPTETISRCYTGPQGNRKVIRILTVAVYVLAVSLAAIMLSLYYIFIWDPTIRPFVRKPNNCEKLVIPEKIAIRLLNSSEVTAEQFYKNIQQQYRILSQLQQQRQQFFQKQQLHFQQLSAANKFQDIFATATIIQANPNDPLRKPITPTNGTYMLQPQPIVEFKPNEQLPILGTEPAHTRRRAHRKHYSHHRHNTRKYHRKPSEGQLDSNRTHIATPLNPLPPVVQEPPILFTPIPIPLILNSKEEKRPHHGHGEKNSDSMGRKRTTSASVSGYDTPTYLNPFLAGELIFEK